MLKKIKQYLFRPYVPLIRIEGPITPAIVHKVSQALKKVKVKRSEALALEINSPGGSMAQVQKLADELKEFSKKSHLKTLCFAGSYCLSNSYLLLALGEKVYVDEFSRVGALKVGASQVDLKELAKKVHLEPRIFTSNRDTLRYRTSPFRQHNDFEDKTSLEIAEMVQENITSQAEQLRGGKIKSGKDSVFNGEIWLGEKVVEKGLADELGSVDAMVYKLFPKALIQEMTPKSPMDQTIERVKRIIKLLTSRGLPIILALFTLKAIIKYTIIITLYYKAKRKPIKKDGEVTSKTDGISNGSLAT